MTLLAAVEKERYKAVLRMRSIRAENRHSPLDGLFNLCSLIICS